MSERIRSTLSLAWKDEIKELDVTFSVIDRISAQVDWAHLLETLGSNKGRPLTKVAQLVYYTLIEADFTNVDIDKIYDEVMSSEEGATAYISVAMEIAMAFTPQGIMTEAKKKDGSLTPTALQQAS